ncbi:glycosyltransferase [Desulfurococcaceae archaeon MEX13E-LK6-19]|nr:glycosyltransferase [Desulfurococcaceae archaeon MEX13E-LK6-19]
MLISILYHTIMVIVGILTLIDIIVWIKASSWYTSSLKNISELKTLRYPGRISVIIPARNEWVTLRELLDKLLSYIKSRPGIEVMVVDDGSTDETPNAIKQLIRCSMGLLKYIRVNEIPKDWAPKPYLLYTGYLFSSGETLVFIDGDTIPVDGSIVEYLAANTPPNTIASLAPRFHCRTRVCKIIETVLTTISHAFLGFNRVCDKKHRLAWYYGCCWSINRELYEKLGTHKIVKKSIVEDRDFAEIAKKNGVNIKVYRGWDLIATKWHDSIRENINVLARVLRRYGLKRRKSIIGAILIILGYTMPLLSLGLGLLNGSIILTMLGILAYTIMLYPHYISAKINKYNPLYTLTIPIGGIILALGIIAAAYKKKLSWKNRVVEEPYYCSSSSASQKALASSSV